MPKTFQKRTSFQLEAWFSKHMRWTMNKTMHSGISYIYNIQTFIYFYYWGAFVAEWDSDLLGNLTDRGDSDVWKKSIKY